MGLSKALKLAVLFCTAILMTSGIYAAALNPDDWARPEAIATPAWLAEHYNDADVVVIDGSDYKDGTYQKVTIEGATFVPYRDLRWNKGLYMGMYWGMEKELWDEEPLETLMRKAGVNDDSTVVAVGQARIDDAADVWWVLKMLGHDDVKLLPVNYLEQPELEGIITSEVPRAKELEPSGNFEAEMGWNWYATRDDIIDAMTDSEVAIQDNRHKVEYTGQVCPGVRCGYIPTAKLWDFRDYHTDKSSAELKSASDLQGKLETMFGSPDMTKKIISYCQSAHRSGLGTWLAYVSGYDAANFDGSWRYYAADGSLPVANAGYPVTGDAIGSLGKGVQDATAAADEAKSAAEDAQATADEAKSAAEDAQATASEAQATAEEAKATGKGVCGPTAIALLAALPMAGYAALRRRFS